MAATRSPLESPSSPSVSSAAAVLTRVQSKEGMDQAAGFLLSLAAVSSAEHERLGGRGGKNGSSRGGGKVPGSARTPSVGKRARASSEDADGKGGSARRRLKMRTASAANGGHGSLLGQQQQQQQQASRRRPAAAVSAVPTGPPPLLAVTGVSAPVRLLSGASLLQLKLLSAAFKLCPHPTAEQVRAIAQRVSLPEAKLEMWFASRRSLQGWVDATPNLKPSQLAEMFYTRRDEAPPRGADGAARADGAAARADGAATRADGAARACEPRPNARTCGGGTRRRHRRGSGGRRRRVSRLPRRPAASGEGRRASRSRLAPRRGEGWDEGEALVGAREMRGSAASGMPAHGPSNDVMSSSLCC